MKKREKGDFFNWSRVPTGENVQDVYIASPNSYVDFNKGITKEEFVRSMHTYSELQELNNKKEFFKLALFTTLASIPFIIIFYNVIIRHLEISSN